MALLDDIQAFIETHAITERQFGEMATNDKNLVPQLKGERGPRPRRPWPETEARIRDFMSKYGTASPPARADAPSTVSLRAEE